jgi:hypothetical protein
MRLPIPAIFSLMLSLPYAFAGNTLATPLTVTLVTDYADGWVDILNPGKTDTINIKTSTHTIPVDGVDIWHVHDYPFDVVDVTNIQQFRVRRSSWGARESIVSHATIGGGVSILIDSAISLWSPILWSPMFISCWSGNNPRISESMDMKTQSG